MPKMPRLRVNEKTDLEQSYMGTCENCGKENVRVRRIEAIGMFKESRGHYDLCFKCVGPQILWKSKEYGDMKSPMDIPYNELDAFLEKYFSKDDLKVGDTKEVKE